MYFRDNYIRFEVFSNGYGSNKVDINFIVGNSIQKFRTTVTVSEANEFNISVTQLLPSYE